jgi:hypothetical protein
MNFPQSDMHRHRGVIPRVDTRCTNVNGSNPTDDDDDDLDGDDDAPPPPPPPTTVVEKRNTEMELCRRAAAYANFPQGLQTASEAHLPPLNWRSPSDSPGQLSSSGSSDAGSPGGGAARPPVSASLRTSQTCAVISRLTMATSPKIGLNMMDRGPEPGGADILPVSLHDNTNDIPPSSASLDFSALIEN